MINDYVFDILIENNELEASQDMIELFESIYVQNLNLLKDIESEESRRFAEVMGYKLRENLDRYYDNITSDRVELND